MHLVRLISVIQRIVLSLMIGSKFGMMVRSFGIAPSNSRVTCFCFGGKMKEPSLRYKSRPTTQCSYFDGNRNRSSDIFSKSSSTTEIRNAHNEADRDPLSTSEKPHTTKKIRIIGGGLAGLSVAYHLLAQKQGPDGLQSFPKDTEQQYRKVDITIDDVVPQTHIGCGGASAVAGGLLHPLSPRGKLVHWGLEGLTATNVMIDAAIDATSRRNFNHLDAEASTNNVSLMTIRLRNELYRIATSNEQIEQLQDIALLYPKIAEWTNYDGRDTALNSPIPPSDLRGAGALRLHNGCCVVHVPSYLRGVYKACEMEANRNGSFVRWRHLTELPTFNKTIDNEKVEQYDAVVYCFGSNMFERQANNNQLVNFTALKANKESCMKDSYKDLGSANNGSTQFPVQLVRGQSMEVQLEKPIQHALLCGKYVSPLPSNDPDINRALIGATHEFAQTPLSSQEVQKDLQSRTESFVPFLYNDGNHFTSTNEEGSQIANRVVAIDRITCGYRVQSSRGKYGRRPIIGRLPQEGTETSSTHWIFTGLSSRGMLYHALYGQILAQGILENDEEILSTFCNDILWWK